MPLDLKTTVNLPKTNFPMKANLPQNEPKILARWEEAGIYERIQEARKGLSGLRFARWAALRQRRPASRPRPEQVLEGFHRQVQEHGWI